MCQAVACMSYASVMPLVSEFPDVTTPSYLSALHLHIAKRKTLVCDKKNKIMTLIYETDKRIPTSEGCI